MIVTLDEAVGEHSRGTEVPFNCPVHDDTHASASVNVVKGVWYCYACGASGTVDGVPAPSAKQLQAMLDVTTPIGQVSDSWVDVIYDRAGYWSARFREVGVTAEETLRIHRTFPFGTMPLTGLPVYLVADQRHNGWVGGVVRNVDPQQPKYSYPLKFTASRNLYGLPRKQPAPPATVAADAVVLVESAFDVAALSAVGITAYGTYGSSLHAGQMDLLKTVLRRTNVVLLGFDMDEAGEKGARTAAGRLDELGIPWARVSWPAKDPTTTPTDMSAAVSVVRRTLRATGRR